MVSATRCCNKKLPKFSSSCIKSSHSIFILVALFYTIAPLFGLLLLENLSPRTFQIVRSGHIVEGVLEYGRPVFENVWDKMWVCYTLTKRKIERERERERERQLHEKVLLDWVKALQRCSLGSVISSKLFSVKFWLCRNFFFVTSI